MAVLFVFIDGVGLGKNSPENPLASDSLRSFSYFTGANGIHEKCETVDGERTLFKAIDANLGVEGLPQSGTGQVTLFSGINASKMIGKHFGPYPYSKTKPLLEKGSLFHKAIEMGKKPCFLNAYPDIFFKRSNQKNRWTSTTLMVKSAGIRLNGVEDVKRGKAITAEITQAVWREMLGLDVIQITPEEASHRALKALEEYDLVLYEYYLTDKAGHAMDRVKADQVLENLDRFLWEIIKKIGSGDTLVITSDHGNLEDLSVKTHTRNAVPLFVKGNCEPFRDSSAITDITPAILELFK